MTYNTAILPCGLRVIHRQTDSPVLYCGYAVNAGTRDERPEEPGMAHFCEHLTFKGTERRGAIKIINALECVGGELNAFTTKEHTVYYSAVLKDHFAKAVDLLTDIVFHSTYPQTEIDKEVEVICDEIESYNDSPAELIYDEFESLLFDNHPLGRNILGEAARLREYTTADARRFASEHYRPANAVFFAYGNVDFKRLTSLLRRATKDMPDGEPLIRKPADSGLPPYTPANVTLNKATHQAHVMIGNRAYGMHDPRRMALYLLNNILGGPGMNARLNMLLRERHGLVYTVESTMASYRDTGVWSVYFGCDPGDVRRCRRLVLHELKRIAAQPLSNYQLEAAKRQIKGQIAIACDNREGFALDIGRTYLNFGTEKDVDKLFAHIDAITPNDITAVGTEVFAPDKLTTLVIK